MSRMTSPLTPCALLVSSPAKWGKTIMEVVVEVGTELVGRDGVGLGGGGVVGRGGLTLSWDRCCHVKSLRSLDDGQAGTHLVASLL